MWSAFSKIHQTDPISIGSFKYLFFGKCFQKKTTEYFLKFLFLFESTILPVKIMENNFIQMAASAGHAVAYTIGITLSTLSIVCSCISPILSFKASIVSGLSG